MFKKMKVGIYSPFPPVFGGGERYCLTIAEVLAQYNDVDFISQFNYDLQEFSKAFNLNLKKVKFVKKSGAGQFFLPQIKKEYDLFICLSNHINPPVFSWGKKGILIIQFPFPYNQVELGEKAQVLLKNFKHASYDLIICYSKFSKKWVEKLSPSNRKILVFSSPIDVSHFTSTAKKENNILSVGRFFKGDHEKRQVDLIDAFKDLVNEKILKWNYHIAGGVSNFKYFKTVERAISDFPIFLHPDALLKKLKTLYGKAKIFWHGTGLFNNEDKTPWKSEHFGIVVLEAMSAGCVPVVVNKGALGEFVKHGKNGFLFNSLEELKKWTKKLIDDDKLREKLSENAVETAERFDKKIFKRKLLRIVKELMK